MDITNDLLVVLMYVVLLTIGIGNIVVTLAAIIQRPPEVKTYWIHNSWMILMLLVYFNLFWHTLDLFAVEGWKFAGFLYIISGPVLIFFATQILLPDLAVANATDLKSYYYQVSRKFFLFFAMLQVWIIGVDLILDKGFTTSGLFNTIAAGLALSLAFLQQQKFHGFGTAFASLLFILAVVFRGVGIIN